MIDMADSTDVDVGLVALELGIAPHTAHQGGAGRSNPQGACGANIYVIRKMYWKNTQSGYICMGRSIGNTSKEYMGSCLEYIHRKNIWECVRLD